MEDMINDLLLAKEHKRGGLPESNKRYDPSTISNYLALFAQQEGITVTDDSVPKTKNRWVQEQSWIGSTQYSLVVASTHCYPVMSEDPEWRKELDDIPEDDKLLYRIMSDFHGGRPIRFTPPHNVMNIDETTLFICKGVQPDNEKKIGLVSKAALHTKDKLSICHAEDSNKMNGMRVKRALVTNGVGDTAEPVIITSLSEYEMPQDEMIPMAFQGLCIGGGGVNGSMSFGHGEIAFHS